MSPDGGLYVLPTLDQIHLDLSLTCSKSYKENAVYIFSHLLTDYKGRIMTCVENAYANSFSKKRDYTCKKVDDVYVLELFHGPSMCLFKDVALTLFTTINVLCLKKLRTKKH